MGKRLTPEEKDARWTAISEAMAERKLDTMEKQQRWTAAAERNAKRKANAAMRKDSVKYRQQINARQRENSKAIQLRLTKSSGLIEIIDQAAKDFGIPVSTYLRLALMEKLRNDGYLKRLPAEEE